MGVVSSYATGVGFVDAVVPYVETGKTEGPFPGSSGSI
jgi:hypothetical protein